MPTLRPALGVLLAAVVSAVSLPVLAPLENRAFDGRLAFRRDAGWPEWLVLVPIDDAALREHGRWPWPREKIASLLSSIEVAGARTIVYDAVAGTPTDEASDSTFERSLARVVFGASRSDDTGADAIDEALRERLIPAEAWVSMRPGEIVAPLPRFGRAAGGVGHVLFEPKADGRVRSYVPLLGIRGEEGSLPSLALAALLHHRGADAATVRADAGSLTLPGGRVLALHRGEHFIDFVPGGSPPARLPAREILERKDPQATAAALRDKLAFVYLDTKAEDRVPTPLGTYTAGGLVHAYALRTLDNGRVPRTAAPLRVLVALFAAIAACSPWIARLPPTRLLALGALAALAWVVPAFALVRLADWFLPVATPVLFLALSGIVLAFDAAREREAERVRLQSLLREASEGGKTVVQPVNLDAEESGPDPRSRGTPTHEQRFPEPGRPLEKPVVVGRYLVHRSIGRGGMGAIFLAKDQDLDRLVAIKVLETPSKGDYLRFRREALAVARVSHPNVVQIYEIASDADRPYIAMEYVAGGTVADVLRDPALPATPPWERMSRIVLGVARGLGAAHAVGIVHRDVKPSNLLLVSRDGDVAKVADFGIAKLAGATESLTREGSFLGTIGYLSPEQATGAQVDARSDVYSLGITWYRMLTGRPAFEGTTAQVLRSALVKEVPDPRILNPEVPEPLVAVLRKMTRIDRGERQRDCNEAAAEIEAALAAAAEARARAPQGAR